MPEPVIASEIADAYDRVGTHVRRTPVLDVDADTFDLGFPLILKLELLQVTGSFKARGALSLLSAREVPDAGVVAASGGNFGLGIAWAAAKRAVPATIFVPASSPAAKIDRLRTAGAQVRVVDGYYADALAAAEDFVVDTGALRAHAYDQREVVAGQGTIALELEQQAEFDTVIVACGGGGLLAGVAGWLGDRIRIIAVETNGTATLDRACAAGGPVDIEVSGIAASSLGARRLGSLAWEAFERWGDDHVLISDDDVLRAQALLWRDVRLVAEPGGVAALAALTSGVYRPVEGERVAVVVCGANTDLTDVAREV